MSTLSGLHFSQVVLLSSRITISFTLKQEKNWREQFSTRTTEHFFHRLQPKILAYCSLKSSGHKRGKNYFDIDGCFLYEILDKKKKNYIIFFAMIKLK